MSMHWRAHAMFVPEGEMYFGVEADTFEEAGDAADSRLAAFGLPVGEVSIAEVPAPAADW